MILIWDNGNGPDDHETRYYDCEGWPLEDVKKLAEMLGALEPGGELVGIVEPVEWDGWAQDPAEALRALTWAPQRLRLAAEHAPVLRRCMPKVLEYTVAEAERDRHFARHPVPHIRDGAAARLTEHEALVAKILELTKETT